MGRFKGGIFMNTAKKHAGHAISQFTLTQNLLNNLSQFKLTPTAKLVLLELSSFYNPKKVDMFPKQKTLAKKLGISERSVVRAIQELLNEGLILVECKYTNHYKFTSKIVAQQPENKNFYNEDMSEDFGQNGKQLNDKMAEHEYEPTKEHIKEPQESGENVYYGDDLILYEYAKNKAKYNVYSFMKAIKEKGGDKKIISEYKKKKNVTQIALRSIQETQELIKEQAELEKTKQHFSQSEAMLNFAKKHGLKK